MKVLLIEDDARVAEEVVQALGSRGHLVSHILDGDRGLEAALSSPIDVLITDRMLPGQDGLEIVQALRKAGRTVPVLVLSALDSVDERVRGLRAGGDDYLGKPFAIEELIARVESLGRRSPPASETALKVEDLELDLLARRARRAGRGIERLASFACSSASLDMQGKLSPAPCCSKTFGTSTTTHKPTW